MTTGKIFMIYYLLSGAYMVHCLIRYRDHAEKQPAVEMLGFKFAVLMQLLFGFIIFPFVLVQQIQLIFLKRSNRKLKKENQNFIRSKYVIETTIPEESKFIGHLNNEEITLGEFIDNILYFIEYHKKEISIPQFIVIKDGRGGWLEDGDPDNLLENGHEKIATITPIVQS